MTYIRFDSRGNLNENTILFIQEITFVNVACEMSAILFEIWMC